MYIMQLLKRIKRYLSGIYRAIHPKPLPSLEFSSNHWNEEYGAKKWDYMGSLPELGRYAMIAGYVSHLNPTASILEVGCGTGLLFQRLRHLPFTKFKGVDISETAIETANQMASENVSFEIGDGAKYDDENTYDIIIFNETLYYFNDCISVLEHYKKKLNNNGFFIISMVFGDVSNSHWRKIENAYRIEDTVRVTNNINITWTCRLVGPQV